MNEKEFEDMNEREFENIIVEHPELIEDGLVFIERQVYLEGKYLDLLFQDKNGQKVIVELKLIAKRKDVAQLIDYAGYFIDKTGVPIRTILVANVIPPNFRKSLEYFGFEYKEIPNSKIRQFIPNYSKPKSSILTKNSLNDEQTKKGEFKLNEVDKNVTRQTMANKLKRGKFFKQARVAFLLLKDNPSKSFTMKDIIGYMNSNGYKSKSYYDLFNAFTDTDLVEITSIQGKKAYRMKE